MDTLPSASSPQASVCLYTLCTCTVLLRLTGAVWGFDCDPELLLFLGEFLFGRKISVEESMEEKNPCESPPEILYQTQWEESLGKGDEDEEEKHFCMLMESLGANSVFEEWVLYALVCTCDYSLCC